MLRLAVCCCSIQLIHSMTSELGDSSLEVISEAAEGVASTLRMPPNAGRVLGLVSVGSDICRPTLAVLIMEDDEVGEELTGTLVLSDLPNVPRSREEREPMLRKLFMPPALEAWPLLLPFRAEAEPEEEPLVFVPFSKLCRESLLRSRPPRTLLSSPQIPVMAGSLLGIKPLKPCPCPILLESNGGE